MKVYSNFKPDDSIETEPIVTSIGGFDGIHLGHQALFEKAFIESKGTFQIVTFNQIPKIYFNKSLDPLLDQNQRTEIFEKLNPKNIVFLVFVIKNWFKFNNFVSANGCNTSFYTILHYLPIIFEIIFCLAVGILDYLQYMILAGKCQILVT